MDCTFMTAEGKFNLRVGAVITDGRRVLVTEDNRWPWYWTIGGRVRFGETAEAAILREIYEELGVHAEIDRLYSIAQKFFTVESTVYHELEFLFLIKPFDISKIDYSAIHCDDENLRLVWLDTAEKPDKQVYPKNLFSAVQDPSAKLTLLCEDELHTQK